MSIVIVAAQNKGRRGGGKRTGKRKERSQVPPSPLFEYDLALTAKVKSLRIVSV